MNFEHDVFTQKDIKDLVWHCLEDIAFEARGNILCLDTVRWLVSAAVGLKRRSARDELIESRAGVVLKPVLEREKTWLPYMRVPGNCTSDPRPKPIGHASVDVISAHSQRYFLQLADMLNRSNYSKVECVPSCHPPYTTEMDKLPRVQRSEAVSEWDVAEIKTGLTHWLKQKSFRWVMELVTKLSGPGNLVIGFYAGKRHAAKKFVHLSKPQSFLGCGKDEGFVKEALPGLHEVYMRPDLSSAVV